MCSYYQGVGLIV
ncbi:hypothetical protein F383_19477 [Gossypium arboreum]|uniref:Uncharacterized protein n=1 Tax=Gossypium arboreum TaxID=29729 RepID=A0A0B0NTX3_GOSAR|nr:hypothetical protein F383_19477 [Gossypium arboreum]